MEPEKTKTSVIRLSRREARDTLRQLGWRRMDAGRQEYWGRDLKYVLFETAIAEALREKHADPELVVLLDAPIVASSLPGRNDP